MYVGSIGDLLLSTDRGETFVPIAPELQTDIILDIEVEPKSGALILATRDHGILKGSRNPEGGFRFDTIGALPGEDPAYYLALDLKNPQTLYAFGKSNALSQSTDGGKVWKKLH